jgi:polygalacturonase
MKIVIFLSGVLTASWALTGCQTQQANAPTSASVSANPGMATPDIPVSTISIVNFGAVGDGKTDNTAAFAKAIDSCADTGGGHVIVPAGTWFTGPIHLRSRIDFHLDAGAVVLFSRKFDD